MYNMERNLYNLWYSISVQYIEVYIPVQYIQ